MAQWMWTLPLGDLRNRFEDDEIDLMEFGRLVSERIYALPIMQRYLADPNAEVMIENDVSRLDELADQFANALDDDVEEFDYILGDLYDWADEDFYCPDCDNDVEVTSIMGKEKCETCGRFGHAPGWGSKKRMWVDMYGKP